MPWTTETIVVASDDQVSTVVGGDVVILGMRDGIYYGLNQVGVRIWELVRSPRRIDDLITLLTSEFDIDAASCERDTIALLGDLAERGLVHEARGSG